MNTTNNLTLLYVLKVKGEKGLIFKTKHPSPEYLRKIAEELVSLPKGHYREYEVHTSDHSNTEMTQGEILLHS